LGVWDMMYSALNGEMADGGVVALSYVAEVIDQLLPEREPSDDIFRLTLAVVNHLQGESIWMPLTYFDLWIVRLNGLLPDLHECVMCGATLNGSRAYFHPLADGLLCATDKRPAGTAIPAG